MSEKPSIWVQLGFYGVFYLVFLIIIVVGYPLAQQYAKPIARFIFPINESNSLMKNIFVMTGMYWGMVGIVTFLNRKKTLPPS